MRSAADVGVNELCQHAGVKKGSFYHFFTSKQDLLLSTVDELAEFVETGEVVTTTEQLAPTSIAAVDYA